MEDGRDMVHKARRIIARGRRLYARARARVRWLSALALSSYAQMEYYCTRKRGSDGGVYTHTCVRGLRIERPYVALNSETRKLHFELIQNQVSVRDCNLSTVWESNNRIFLLTISKSEAFVIKILLLERNDCLSDKSIN